MKTVHEIKMAHDPDLFVGMLARDAGLTARRKAKTEAYRKACMTKTERELEAVKAQRVKDMETQRHAFQARVTRMVQDHAATTATLVTAALAAGYILALL